MCEADIVNWMDRRFAISDRFRSRLLRFPGDFTLPYWVVDEDFAITNHVVVHKTGYTWPEANRLLSEVADTPLDLSRPPWKVHIIPDVSGMPAAEGLSTIVAVHFHHVAFDGISFGGFARRIFSDEPLKFENYIGSERSSAITLGVKEIGRMPSAWFGAARAFVREARQARNRPSAPTQTWPATRFNAPLIGPRVADFVEFSLSDIAAIKSQIPGATVNDVILSIVGQTVTRYLAELGEPPTESMSALSPMSTRNLLEEDTLNQFSLIVTDMHTTEPTLVERIAAIANTTMVEKKRVADWSTTSGVGMIGAMPAPIIRLICRANNRSNRTRSDRTGSNVVLSNVRVSGQRRKIFGTPIDHAWAIQPLTSGVTLAHAVANVGDSLMMSVTADATCMPDLPRYRELLLESFHDHVAILDRPAGRSPESTFTRAALAEQPE
jgi:WS/DGAT/MGAT family acyltransferase